MFQKITQIVKKIIPLMILNGKGHIIVSWCISELSKYVSWKIWAWPCKISLGLKMTKSQIRSFNWYWYAEVYTNTWKVTTKMYSIVMYSISGCK